VPGRPSNEQHVTRSLAEKRRTAIGVKLRRMAAGGRPRILELCSGAGGFSLGFHAAGFELGAAVEFDPVAAVTHAANFFKSERARAQLWAKPRDLTVTEPEQLAEEFGLDRPDEAFDVLVAGLPCQAFARIGRPKLREVHQHPEAFRHDPRGRLYVRFLHYVAESWPLAVVVENVPDILNYGGHNVPEEICQTLEQWGYVCRYTLINAAFYGVPQMRERLFLIAYAGELSSVPQFPLPTHWLQLPKGYEHIRNSALNRLRAAPSHYTVAPPPTRDLLPAVTARQALGDLPEIFDHLAKNAVETDRGRRGKGGVRRTDEFVAYRRGRPSAYAISMRTWAGFETDGAVTGHVIRNTPRDFPTFKAMREGDEYPEAYRIAEDRFERELRRLERDGVAPSQNSKRYEALRASTIPPYDPLKFVNKWWKLGARIPSRTLTAHMGKDTYSHIHYDSDQARSISVREAARLMSFPDGFVFAGAMNAGFRQIGNAVPPLLARSIAQQIREALLQAARIHTGGRRAA
jgi:DNA (cytosine-5)-methyltransferase 1